MSFQITILKVLAGRVDGRATRAELTRQVSILISSGTDWSERTKRLAALAPGLNIFGSGFVSLDDAGWQITEAGQTFLLSLEAATPAVSESDCATTDEMAAAPIADDVVPTVIAPPTQLEQEGVAVSRPSKLMSLIGSMRRRPRQSRHAADSS